MAMSEHMYIAMVIVLIAAAIAIALSHWKKEISRIFSKPRKTGAMTKETTLALSGRATLWARIKHICRKMKRGGRNA
jgi:hypothetical protein